MFNGQWNLGRDTGGRSIDDPAPKMQSTNLKSSTEKVTFSISSRRRCGKSFDQCEKPLHVVSSR